MYIKYTYKGGWIQNRADQYNLLSARFHLFTREIYAIKLCGRQTIHI